MENVGNGLGMIHCAKKIFEQLPGYAILSRNLSKTTKMNDFNKTWFPGRFKGPDYISGVKKFYRSTIFKMAAIEILLSLLL